MGMPGTFDKVSKEIKSTGYTVCPKKLTLCCWNQLVETLGHLIVQKALT